MKTYQMFMLICLMYQAPYVGAATGAQVSNVFLVLSIIWFIASFFIKAKKV